MPSFAFVAVPFLASEYFFRAILIPFLNLSLAALDAANARLRLALIGLHEAVEAKGDTARHHAILRLYARMADLRRLDMPPLPGR